MSDDSASGLFPDAPGGPGGGYLVLARKYRPRRFEDLIGQEAMVRTIGNSFALGRIPQAYMLTGVRGVGKTTTARLIARALNYESDSVKTASISLDPLGRHCAQIMASQHPDVFEMDAASRTGINDVREILDAVRYAPVMARKKVYIIDEVHMLSTAAFNGLLKTLEEPPPHVVFIFATTEIRKVPVTVLSRCQRFDLKRIDPQVLTAHLKAICVKEAIAVDDAGLELIARAAEGSVRDGLSLLDQAMVQRPVAGKAIGALEVRDMLGLADRGRTIEILSALAAGEVPVALTALREQYDSGAEPTQVLRDLLEIAHEAARAQALGGQARIVGGADWEAKIRALAAAQSPGQLSRLWQMLLKALDDASRAPDALAATEMAMIRIAVAASLPPPEDAARLLRSGPAATTSGTQAAPSTPEGPNLTSFRALVSFLDQERQVNLQIDVERFVRLARFSPGEIVFAPAPGMPEDLPLRLARFLREALGEIWTVSAEARQGEDSLSERRKFEEARQKAEIAAHPFVAEALAAFPGARILSVRRPVEDHHIAEVVPLRTDPSPPETRPRKEGKDT
ncbi:MAG: DNA polymerase III subunit gamma/tau [Caulobacterales bacterium]